MKISEIFKRAEELDGHRLEVEGWVIGKRIFQNVAFLYLNDGSSIEGIQLVLKDKDVAEGVNLGSAAVASGVLVYTPNREQKCELDTNEFKLLAQASDRYLIQKNEISLEVLREHPEVRHRSKLLRAVMLVRDRLFREIHRFFEINDFLYFTAPLLTSNDGEGGGETFNVTTAEGGDFFGASKAGSAYLTVTGQLHAEAYAQGFKKVYSFGQTFRAERSHTLKHAAEFLMLEPEVAFCDINCIIKLAHNLLVYLSNAILNSCRDELDYLERYSKTAITARLQRLVSSELKIVEYREAVEILSRHKERFGEDVKFGTDLTNIHERFLTEEYFKSPVAVVNFPKDIKAFYMKSNEGDNTVASFDLLVEEIGEIIGGSQRESDINLLNERLNQLGLDAKGLSWYIRLREFGYYSSSGFGLGFERLLMYITGIKNIRDVIPFPRTAGSMLA